MWHVGREKPDFRVAMLWTVQFFFAQLQESRIAKVTQLPRQIDVETPPNLLLWLRDHQDSGAWTTYSEAYSPSVYKFCRLRAPAK